MELTNEEKMDIANAATKMMQAFCEYKMAEDRLNMMNGLVGKFLQIGLNKDIVGSALSTYMERMRQAKAEFFKALEIEESNKEFWEYVEAGHQEQSQSEQVLTPRS